MPHGAPGPALRPGDARLAGTGGSGAPGSVLARSAVLWVSPPALAWASSVSAKMKRHLSSSSRCTGPPTTWLPSGRDTQRLPT